MKPQRTSLHNCKEREATLLAQKRCYKETKSFLKTPSSKVKFNLKKIRNKHS